MSARLATENLFGETRNENKLPRFANHATFLALEIQGKLDRRPAQTNVFSRICGRNVDVFAIPKP